MKNKIAEARVRPVRQRTQYSCMSASMAMCLQALGHKCDEDEVNKVMGAAPMRGAAWEQALACAQHYGCRATLTMPSTIRQLKEWTDAGIPVMIAWNPEGRDWSHASVVYHVQEGPIEEVRSNQTLQGEGPGLYVYVADPNIPNPDKVTRIVHEDVFYKCWYEKFPNYLVRRPACAIAREVTADGRQVMASAKVAEEMDCYKDYKAGGITWEEYQDCLRRSRGEAKPSRGPQKLVYPTPPDYHLRAQRLLLALWAAKDAVGTRFVKDKLYARELSEKQIQWFLSLERKHARVIRDMPENPELTFGTDGSIFVSKRAASDRGLAKHFDLEHFERDSYRIRHKGTLPVPEPAVSGRATFDRAQTQSMLEILDVLIARNPGLRMLPAFKRDLELGKGLTENQLSAVRKTLYQNHMRSEADMFRMASFDHYADLQFDRFYKSLDLIRKKIGDARDFRGLDLAAEHVPVYVRGGVQNGYLPKSFPRKYNTLLKGLGVVGLSGDIQESKDRWFKILDEMEAAAKKVEGSSRRAAETEGDVMSKNKGKPKMPKTRNETVREMVQKGWGSGKHHTRDRDVAKGRSRKPKHKNQDHYASVDVVATRFLNACGMDGSCSCRCEPHTPEDDFNV